MMMTMTLLQRTLVFHRSKSFRWQYCVSLSFVCCKRILSTHPRLPQVKVVSVGNASLSFVCRKRILWRRGKKRVVQKRRHKKKKKREREGLFLGFENFQKIYIIYIFFSSVEREKTFFEKRRNTRTWERKKDCALFESSNHRIIIVVGCAERDRR